MTKTMCAYAVIKLEEMGIDYQADTPADASEIKLRHRKNGHLQNAGLVLSVMLRDPAIREQIIDNYADKIYEAEHLSHSVRQSKRVTTYVSAQPLRR